MLLHFQVPSCLWGLLHVSHPLDFTLVYTYIVHFLLVCTSITCYIIVITLVCTWITCNIIITLVCTSITCYIIITLFCTSITGYIVITLVCTWLTCNIIHCDYETSITSVSRLLAHQGSHSSPTIDGSSAPWITLYYRLSYIACSTLN